MTICGASLLRSSPATLTPSRDAVMRESGRGSTSSLRASDPRGCPARTIPSPWPWADRARTMWVRWAVPASARPVRCSNSLQSAPPSRPAIRPVPGSRTQAHTTPSRCQWSCQMFPHPPTPPTAPCRSPNLLPCLPSLVSAPTHHCHPTHPPWPGTAPRHPHPSHPGWWPTVVGGSPPHPAPPPSVTPPATGPRWSPAHLSWTPCSPPTRPYCRDTTDTTASPWTPRHPCPHCPPRPSPDLLPHCLTRPPGCHHPPILTMATCRLSVQDRK